MLPVFLVLLVLLRAINKLPKFQNSSAWKKLSYFNLIFFSNTKVQYWKVIKVIEQLEQHFSEQYLIELEIIWDWSNKWQAQRLMFLQCNPYLRYTKSGFWRANLKPIFVIGLRVHNESECQIYNAEFKKINSTYVAAISSKKGP